MVDSIEYDLLIVGSGLAGLRAAIAAAKKSPKIKIAVISKVQVMRSHSVSAEGGTAAVLFEDEGDTIESHIYDTIKGSDFLADQNVEERLSSGTFYTIKAKALIIAAGGAGRIYSFATYALSSTPDGIDMAYRAGMALKDMEFVQFHPTGILPSGILITEGARGEGGYLLNNAGERFMKKYAAGKMELAPRDIVSRAMMTEINEGRGFDNETGVKCMKLDLRHLGDSLI